MYERTLVTKLASTYFLEYCIGGRNIQRWVECIYHTIGIPSIKRQPAKLEQQLCTGLQHCPTHKIFYSFSNLLPFYLRLCHWVPPTSRWNESYVKCATKICYLISWTSSDHPVLVDNNVPSWVQGRLWGSSTPLRPSCLPLGLALS